MTSDWRAQLRPRPLTAEERAQLLDLEHPAHLASIDPGGFPHITPIWFVWDGAAFVMTSLPDPPCQPAPRQPRGLRVHRRGGFRTSRRPTT
jgi:hypothetical protein